MNAYEKFLELLDVAIAKAGGTHYKLAVQLGIQATSVTRWVEGNRIPSLKTIQPVLDYLEADIFDDLQISSATPPKSEIVGEGAKPDGGRVLSMRIQSSTRKEELERYKALLKAETERREYAEKEIEALHRIIELQLKTKS